MYSRCESLLDQNRTLGFAYAAVKETLMSEHKKSVMVLEYNQLAKSPDATMKAIYKFINEPFYQHDFNDVEASYDEFDADVQLPGLHTTRKVVSFNEPVMVLPLDIQHTVAQNYPSVWK